MTEVERLLALEAAACAAEGCCGSDETRAAISLLQDALDKEPILAAIEAEGGGVFVARQERALRALLLTPAAWGGGEDPY